MPNPKTWPAEESTPATVTASDAVQRQRPRGPTFRFSSLRTRSFYLFSAITLAIAIGGGFTMGDMFTLSDTKWYLSIAEGNTALVLQPFSSRQLGPLIVKALHHIFAIGIQQGFVIEALVSIVILVGIVGYLLTSQGVRLMALAAIAGLGFWPILFNGFVLPDLWFAALLSVFLLLLEREQYLGAALMFFPLWLTREVAVLVLVCFLVAYWRRLRLVYHAVAVASGVGGALVVKHLASVGLGNQERIGYATYMIGKVPWNLLRNGLGIMPWINLRTDICAVPVWKMNVHFDRVTAVGICGWDPGFPLWMFHIALASFGLLPVLFVFLLKQKGAWWPANPMLRFCILYGLLSIALAPMIGVTLVRYFGYAWPLFVIALPQMTLVTRTLTRGAACWFLPAHFLLAWTLVPYHTRKFTVLTELALFAFAGVLYIATWIALSKGRPIRFVDQADPNRAGRAETA